MGANVNSPLGQFANFRLAGVGQHDSTPEKGYLQVTP